MPCDQIPPPPPPSQPTCAPVSGSPGRSESSRLVPRTRGCGNAKTPPGGWQDSRPSQGAGLGIRLAMLPALRKRERHDSHSTAISVPASIRSLSTITIHSQTGCSICFLMCPGEGTFSRVPSRDLRAWRLSVSQGLDREYEGVK